MSPVTKRLSQSCHYRFYMLPPDGSSALVLSWKVLVSAPSRWESRDCPIVSLDLGFPHPVPWSLAMRLLLRVPAPPPLVFPRRLAPATPTLEVVLLSLPSLSALHPDGNHDPMVPSNSPRQHVQNRILTSHPPIPDPPLKPPLLSIILNIFHPFLVSPPLKYFGSAPSSPICLAQEILSTSRLSS